VIVKLSVPQKSRPVLLVASQDAEARSKWRKALRRSFSVHEEGGKAGLEEMLRVLKPNILLLDLELRHLGGVDSLAALDRISPSTKIIVLTSAPKPHEELRAVKLGAKGYARRDINSGLLRKAVSGVQSGEIWVGRRIISSLIEEIRDLRKEKGSHPPTNGFPKILVEQLSSRKREIALLVAEGGSNKEIANKLNITEATVKAHLTEIFLKFGISNRLQLALIMKGGRKSSSFFAKSKLSLWVSLAVPTIV
jgi:DNA-binding NarL/FixJ family response regulator